MNNGLAAEHDQWVYAQFKDGLYKMKLDGTDKGRITEDIVSYINVWDGWIYYSNGYPGNGEIYRIAPDGSSKKKINNERSYYTIIKDGWIYYSTVKYITLEEVEFKIKKIKIDGTNEMDIIYETKKGKEINPSGYFFLSDGWIYYRSILDMNKLYRVQDNGKNKSKVSDNASYGEFIVDQNWIYYIQPNDGNKLYKMKTDGTEKELVINKSIGNINITDEYIFYTDESENYKLYKKNKGSSVESKLSDYSVSDINVIGDWLYCRDFYSELKFYKISSAGTSNSGEIVKP
jgi:hypothetical protein